MYQDLSKWNVSNITDMEGMFSGCDSFDFKNFKRKVINDDELVEDNELIKFNKEKLLEYLAMYKHNDPMKMKVLSTLNKEQILCITDIKLGGSEQLQLKEAISPRP